MKKIVILASGSGSNAQKIIDYFSSNATIDVFAIITNNTKAGVIERAKKANIPFIIISKKQLYDTTQLKDVLTEIKPDLIVLAGFLLLIPSSITSLYKNKIINIHPALLPKYGGKGMYGSNVHKAVHANHEKQSGITIHFVNELYDDGEYIFQTTCDIADTDSPKQIAENVLKLEHQYFSQVIEDILMRQ